MYFVISENPRFLISTWQIELKLFGVSNLASKSISIYESCSDSLAKGLYVCKILISYYSTASPFFTMKFLILSVSYPASMYYFSLFLLAFRFKSILISLGSVFIKHRISPQMILSSSLNAGLRYSSILFFILPYLYADIVPLCF